MFYTLFFGVFIVFFILEILFHFFVRTGENPMYSYYSHKGLYKGLK